MAVRRVICVKRKRTEEPLESIGLRCQSTPLACLVAGLSLAQDGDAVPPPKRASLQVYRLLHTTQTKVASVKRWLTERTGVKETTATQGPPAAQRRAGAAAAHRKVRLKAVAEARGRGGVAVLDVARDEGEGEAPMPPGPEGTETRRSRKLPTRKRTPMACTAGSETGAVDDRDLEVHRAVWAAVRELLPGEPEDAAEFEYDYYVMDEDASPSEDGDLPTVEWEETPVDEEEDGLDTAEAGGRRGWDDDPDSEASDNPNYEYPDSDAVSDRGPPLWYGVGRAEEELLEMEGAGAELGKCWDDVDGGLSGSDGGEPPYEEPELLPEAANSWRLSEHHEAMVRQYCRMNASEAMDP
eukprot:EG_transcript_15723